MSTFDELLRTPLRQVTVHLVGSEKNIALVINRLAKIPGVAFVGGASVSKPRYLKGNKVKYIVMLLVQEMEGDKQHAGG